MSDRTFDMMRFLETAGWADAQRHPVTGDASNRRYNRLVQPDGATAILMDAPPDLAGDVQPFVDISEHLRAHGISAPEIYHADVPNGFLLLEDFGDALFADLMAQTPERELPLYRDAADVLLHLRGVPKPDLHTATAAWLGDMLAPLFDWYAPETSPAPIAAFRESFDRHATEVAEVPTVMMLRDYHAQNLLFLPERRGISRVGVLDFQDAMLAHPAYDLVSVLQDARRDVSAKTEAEIMAYYLDRSGDDPARFRRHYALLGLQRNLRILGIFARLCLKDGKAQYLAMMPRVWGYIERNLSHPDLDALRPLLDACVPAPSPALLAELKSRCPNTAIPS